MTDTAVSAAATNIASLRRGYEAFQSGDLDLLRNELFDPDIVWHVPGRNQTSGDHRGIDAVLANFMQNFELTGGTFKVEVHDILGSDDHAVALATVSGERNGKSLSQPYAHVCHFRGGKLSEAWIVDYDVQAVDEFFS